MYDCLALHFEVTPEFTHSSLFFPQVIAAEGEQKASRALKEASEVIAESSSALQLRYLQVREHEAFISTTQTARGLFSV